MDNYMLNREIMNTVDQRPYKIHWVNLVRNGSLSTDILKTLSSYQFT